MLKMDFVAGSVALVSRSALKAVVFRYGPVVSSVVAALAVSLVLRAYVYPRPLVLLALVLSMWGRGWGPGLVGAGFATIAVRFAFPELLPRYGSVYDAAMFVLAAVSVCAYSGSKVRAEAALRESEERFRQVFEEGPLGVALVGKDHRFLKVNSALCRMVGYDEAELTQMSFATSRIRTTWRWIGNLPDSCSGGKSPAIGCKSDTLRRMATSFGSP